MENKKELKDQLLVPLIKVYDDFIHSLNSFTEQQVNETPFEGSWTPGQVTDHIIKATGGIPDQNAVPADRGYNEKVAMIESVFLNFELRFKSPDFVFPGNGPFERNELVSTLK